MEDNLWVATFGDVARYMRERMDASVSSELKRGEILVDVGHSLDAGQYDLPLTLKTYVPTEWKEVQVEQEGRQKIQPLTDSLGSYVLYRAIPGGGRIRITGI
jgi:hypothetical protein